MARTKSSLYLAMLSFGVLLPLANPTLFFEPVQAQSPSITSSQELPTNWNNYQPASDIGAPAGREGGGTRDLCVRGAKSLTALLPTNSFGVTVAEYPTFLVYVPPINPDYEVQVEFTLQESIPQAPRGKNKRDIYTTVFPIRQKGGGIVSFSLSPSAKLPPLEKGKSYYGGFTLICDETRTKFVEGLIQRIEPTPQLASDLAGATTPRDKAAVYAKHGVWYDALATLAQLRNNSDNATLVADWSALLKSVGLDNFAKEPLVQSVTASETQEEPISQN